MYIYVALFACIYIESSLHAHRNSFVLMCRALLADARRYAGLFVQICRALFADVNGSLHAHREGFICADV